MESKLYRCLTTVEFEVYPTLCILVELGHSLSDIGSEVSIKPEVPRPVCQIRQPAIKSTRQLLKGIARDNIVRRSAFRRYWIGGIVWWKRAPDISSTLVINHK